MKTDTALQVIGRNALLGLGSGGDIPAKVDTGADSSSLWASDITENKGTLSFVLVDPTSSLYTGETLTTTDFTTVGVASSNGAHQVRYVVYLPVTINGTSYPRVRFTLADRSRMMYPALLGRKTLDGTFVVDVSRSIPADIDNRLREEKQQRLTQKGATLGKGI